MLHRHHACALPTRWLVTDERMGRGLWHALAQLPWGSGVVFRHYRTPAAQRQRMFRNVRAIAATRGLVLVRAGGEPMRGEHGAHNAAGRGLRTASAHDVAEARRAAQHGARLIFVSPVYPTRSHAGARALGPRRAALIASATSLPVVALGGMDERRFARIGGFHGWAAIDAWAPARQKRKAVPT